MVATLIGGCFLICWRVNVGKLCRKPASMALQRVSSVGLNRLACRNLMRSARPGWWIAELSECVCDWSNFHRPGGHRVPCKMTLLFLYIYNFVLVR